MSDNWSKRNPDYRRGYRLGRAQRRAESGRGGCAVVLLALAPAAAGLAGWGAGAAVGWLT